MQSLLKLSYSVFCLGVARASQNKWITPWSFNTAVVETKCSCSIHIFFISLLRELLSHIWSCFCIFFCIYSITFISDFFFSEDELIWLGEGEGINDSLMFGSLFFFLIHFLALNVLFWCSTVWLAHLFIESMILIWYWLKFLIKFSKKTVVKSACVAEVCSWDLH